MRTVLLSAALIASLGTGAAQAENRTGELRCMVAGGIGYIVVGKRATSCVYYRRDGRVEFYIGSFSRVGLDAGPTQARSAAFEVVTREPAPVGALEGTFMGVGVGDTIGRGVAGDALIGGRGQSVQIVPIANSRLTGLNLNAGISEVHLRFAGSEGRRERYRSDKPEDEGF